MTRVVDFSDGYTSATAPDAQIVIDVYDIDNNSSGDLVLFDELIETSAIIDFELERYDSIATFRQAGRFTCYYDGTDWLLTNGMYSGDNMIQSSITSTEHITLTISTGGQVSYTSGNMTGTGYVGKIKLAITRFTA